MPEELPEKAYFGGRECGRAPRKVVRNTTVKPFNVGDSDFPLPALAALPNFDAVQDHVRETRLDVAVGSPGDPNGAAAFHAIHGLFLIRPFAISAHACVVKVVWPAPLKMPRTYFFAVAELNGSPTDRM